MVGAYAGTNTEWASGITCVGYAAGWDNNRTNNQQDADFNTYVGALAGNWIREGEHNVMVGDSFSDDTGYESTCADDTTGYQSITQCVSDSNDNTMQRTTTAGSSIYVKNNDNVVLGYDGYSNVDRAITIGAYASSTHTDAITIGYDNDSHLADTVVIGNDDTESWEPHADGVTSLGTDSYRFTDVIATTRSATALDTAAALMTLSADLGTDDDDHWQLAAADGGAFTVSSYSTGAWAPVLTLTNSGDLTVAGDMNVNSDRRLKQDVENIDGSLDRVLAVEGVSYSWREGLGRDAERHYGVIAQQVQAVLPELVREGRDGILSVNYMGFLPLLVDAAREVNAEFELLEQRYAQQDEELALLHEQLALQEELLHRLDGR